MTTRRDQLHSHQFMVQRMVAALVMRETDPAQSPFRRAAGASVAGAMVAAIVLAGCLVYGLWVEGGNLRWKTAGDTGGGRAVVVVVKDSGAVYVYRKGTLHPVENVTSARLIAGADHGIAEPYRVSQRSLTQAAEVRIGPRLGISGAPDSLPKPDDLLHGPWSLCSVPRSDTSGADAFETVMLVGAVPRSGTPMEDDALAFVRAPDSSATYLIYGGHRFPVADTVELGPLLAALSAPAAQPFTAPTSWLNALPLGRKIAPLVLPGAGQRSDAVAIAVGTLVEVPDNTSPMYYVVARDGLVPVTPFQAAVERTHGTDVVSLSTAEVAAVEMTPYARVHRGEQASPPSSDQPDVEDVDARRAVCAVYNSIPSSGTDDQPPVIRHGVLREDLAGGVRTRARTPEGRQLADRVVVAPGTGALVSTVPAGGGADGRWLSLVTDTGFHYPLRDDVLEWLGYPPEAPVARMPRSVVERLPEGPALDADDAWRPTAP